MYLFNFAQNDNKAVALRIDTILLKFFPKTQQDLSLAYLSNFAQIFPKSATRLAYLSNFAQSFPKSATRHAFLSNFAQILPECNKTLALYIYQILPKSATLCLAYLSDFAQTFPQSATRL